MSLEYIVWNNWIVCHSQNEEVPDSNPFDQLDFSAQPQQEASGDL